MKRSLNEDNNFHNSSASDVKKAKSGTKTHRAPFKNKKDKVKIQPNILHNNFDAEYSWKVLKDAIEDILQKNYSEYDFDVLYDHAYKMIQCNKSENLYTAVKEVFSSHLSNSVKKNVIASSNNKFLSFFLEAWNNYKTSISTIQNILMYLDQAYTESHGLKNVFDVGIELFKYKILLDEEIINKISYMLIQTIDAERKKRKMCTSLIKDTYEMLKTAELNKKLFYRYFVYPYINHLREHYAIKGKEMINSKDDALTYFEKLCNCIKEEEEKADELFDTSKKVEVKKLMETELLFKHENKIRERINDAVLDIIYNKKSSDLASLYKKIRPLSLVSQSMLESVLNCFQEMAGNILTGEQNEKDFMKNVINLNKTANDLLKDTSDNNEEFMNGIHKVMKKIFNKSCNSHKILINHIDHTLKKSPKKLPDAEIKKSLADSVQVLKFITNKDVFEENYRNSIVERILENKSINDEFEKFTISLILQEYGSWSSTKLEVMLQDLIASKTLLEEFKKVNPKIKEHFEDMSFQVRVLTHKVWPCKEKEPCILPSIPLKAKEYFEAFYYDARPGRMLSLQPNLGTAEIRAVFVKKETNANGESTDDVQNKIIKRTHILQVSTYHMCILILFNKRDELTYEDIQKQTNICKKDLIRTLVTLSLGRAYHRVLVKTPGTNKIERTDVFKINNDFNSKEIKVKIPEKIKDVEIEKINEEVIEDRTLQIDAAIVRTLKNKKPDQIIANDLMNTIIDILKPYFHPDTTLIETCIEGLIRQGYISKTEVQISEHEKEVYYSYA